MDNFQLLIKAVRRNDVMEVGKLAALEPEALLSRDYANRTLLEVAANLGHLEIIQELLQYVPEENSFFKPLTELFPEKAFMLANEYKDKFFMIESLISDFHLEEAMVYIKESLEWLGNSSYAETQCDYNNLKSLKYDTLTKMKLFSEASVCYRDINEISLPQKIIVYLLFTIILQKF